LLVKLWSLPTIDPPVEFVIKRFGCFVLRDCADQGCQRFDLLLPEDPALHASLPITQEDWNKIPLAVQALVLALWGEVTARREEVSALREQVGKNSKNASRPLSSDPPGTPERKRVSLERKLRGPEGHEGVWGTLKPIEAVKAVNCDQARNVSRVWSRAGGDDPTAPCAGYHWIDPHTRIYHP
jgi:hypothetical protein